MGKAGTELLRGISPDAVADGLDRLRCYELSVLHLALAVRAQLAGQALLVLGPELDEQANESLGRAGVLADRIAELGGSLTADPTHIIERSPVDSFALPERCSQIPPILGYALEQVVAIGAYADLARRVEGKDDLTHHLLLGLLRAHVTREDELEGSLEA